MKASKPGSAALAHPAPPTPDKLLLPSLPPTPQEMYAFTLACYKAGVRGIDLHLKVRRLLTRLLLIAHAASPRPQRAKSSAAACAR